MVLIKTKNNNTTHVRILYQHLNVIRFSRVVQNYFHRLLLTGICSEVYTLICIHVRIFTSIPQSCGH